MDFEIPDSQNMERNIPFLPHAQTDPFLQDSVSNLAERSFEYGLMQDLGNFEPVEQDILVDNSITFTRTGHPLPPPHPPPAPHDAPPPLLPVNQVDHTSYSDRSFIYGPDLPPLPSYPPQLPPLPPPKLPLPPPPLPLPPQPEYNLDGADTLTQEMDSVFASACETDLALVTPAGLLMHQVVDELPFAHPNRKLLHDAAVTVGDLLYNHGIVQLREWQQRAIRMITSANSIDYLPFAAPASDTSQQSQVATSTLVTAPTGGGKSLVVALTIAIQVMRAIGAHAPLPRTLVLSPFISAAREMEELISGVMAVIGSNVTVRGFYGRMNLAPQTADGAVVAIATYERGQGIISKLERDGRIASFYSMVFIDEVHMLRTSERGRGMDMALALVRAAAPACPVIGLTATLPDPKAFEAWLTPCQTCAERARSGCLVHAVAAWEPRKPGMPQLPLPPDACADAFDAVVAEAFRLQTYVHLFAARAEGPIPKDEIRRLNSIHSHQGRCRPAWEVLGAAERPSLGITWPGLDSEATAASFTDKLRSILGSSLSVLGDELSIVYSIVAAVHAATVEHATPSNDHTRPKFPMLVLAPTKDATRAIASVLAAIAALNPPELFLPARPGDAAGTPADHFKRNHSSTPNVHTRRLAALAVYGVAYHNADLLNTDRLTVENGLTNCQLQVVVCTTTLSVGVNLPIQSAVFCGTSRFATLTPTDYVQFAGRAGRGTRNGRIGLALQLLARDSPVLGDGSIAHTIALAHGQGFGAVSGTVLPTPPSLNVSPALFIRSDTVNTVLDVVLAAICARAGVRLSLRRRRRKAESDIRDAMLAQVNAACETDILAFVKCCFRPCVTGGVDSELLRTTVHTLQTSGLVTEDLVEGTRYWQPTDLGQCVAATRLQQGQIKRMREFISERVRSGVRLNCPLSLLRLVVPSYFIQTAEKYLCDRNNGQALGAVVAVVRSWFHLNAAPAPPPFSLLHGPYEIYESVKELQASVCSIFGVNPRTSYPWDDQPTDSSVNDLEEFLNAFDTFNAETVSSTFKTRRLQPLITAFITVTLHYLSKGMAPSTLTIFTQLIGISDIQKLTELTTQTATHLQSIAHLSGIATLDIFTAVRTRLEFAADPEAAELHALPHVTGTMASALTRAGIATVNAVAALDVDELAIILMTPLAAATTFAAAFVDAPRIAREMHAAARQTLGALGTSARLSVIRGKSDSVDYPAPGSVVAVAVDFSSPQGIYWGMTPVPLDSSEQQADACAIVSYYKIEKQQTTDGNFELELSPNDLLWQLLTDHKILVIVHSLSDVVNWLSSVAPTLAASLSAVWDLGNMLWAFEGDGQTWNSEIRLDRSIETMWELAHCPAAAVTSGLDISPIVVHAPSFAHFACRRSWNVAVLAHVLSLPFHGRPPHPPPTTLTAVPSLSTCTTPLHVMPVRWLLQLDSVWNTSDRSVCAATLARYVDIPLASVVYRVASFGMTMSPHRAANIVENLGRLQVHLEKQLTEVATNLYGTACTVDLAGNSMLAQPPKVSARALLSALGCRSDGTVSKTAPGPGAPLLSSTDKKLLAQLAPDCPAASLILSLRSVEKCCSIVEICRSAAVQTTPHPLLPGQTFSYPRIVSTVKLDSAATGRITIETPQMHGIPNAKTYTLPNIEQMDLGDFNPLLFTRSGNTITLYARRMFTAPADRVLITCDYSATELRLAAALATQWCRGGTHEPCAARFNQLLLSPDPFTQVASAVYKIPAEDVTREQRNLIKVHLYACIYGQGREALEHEFGDTSQVQQVLLGLMGHIFDLREAVHTFVDEHGFVVTLGGRCRHFGTGHDPKGSRKRRAWSMVVQGGFSDLFRATLLAVDHTLSKLNSSIGAGAVLVHHVHDEMIIECATSHADVVARAVMGAVAGVPPAFGLHARWPLKVNVGKSWDDPERTVVYGEGEGWNTGAQAAEQVVHSLCKVIPEPKWSSIFG